MSQPQALPAELNFPTTTPPIVVDRSANGPRVANHIDSPIASPVHLLQDKLQRMDEPKGEGESAYAYNVAKAPAWVRMALPLALSVGLWAGILYVVGIID